MNRRSFLQKSSFAALAASGLPLAVKARPSKQTSTTTYKTTDGYTAGQVLYGMAVNHSGITNFASATDEEKTIMMGVKQYDSVERTTPSKSADYKLMIDKVKKVDNTENTWDVTAKVEKMSGDYDLPKEISKKITLRCKTYSSVNIMGKKDAVISELAYVAPSSSSSGSGDCFLTTACVHHRQLPDDCTELQSLRLLREEHMRRSGEGRALIDLYKSAGPRIVQAIDKLENKKEIYEYMYTHMILPSVQLVSEGRKEEAVMYYKIFVGALQERYCQD